MQGQGKSQQPWGQCPNGLRLRERWPRRLALRLMALVWGGLVGMGLLVMPGHAQGSYPPQLDPFLNDYAGLVTPEDAAAIRQLYGDLKQTTGIDAVAVTIQSLAIYETGDQTIESFATNLFNTWEIGDRDRNDGVLVLVSAGDRKLRIELGSGFSRRYDAKMQAIIDDHMLPAFRAGDYSRGLYQGSQALVTQLQRAGPIGSSPTSRGFAGFVDWLGWQLTRLGNAAVAITAGVVGGFGAVVAVVWRSYRRHRPRQCPTCQVAMLRLTEATDDLHLDPGQRLEEKINSVDYDVWKCPQCSRYETHRYRNFFSRFSTCPRCRYRTLRTHRQVIVHATYSHSGRERVRKSCQHCSYLNEYTRTIPRRHRSSSSRGGGRSSGGGASGSW